MNKVIIKNGLSLEQLQGQFSDYILCDQRAICMVVDASQQKAEIGLDIYRNGYYLRFLEILGDDYAALRELLGWDQFDALIHRYIKQHTMRSPCVAYVGYQLINFLRQPDLVEPLCLEMAVFERAFLNLWYTPLLTLLTKEKLQQIKPEDWIALRFTLQPTLQHIRFHYPVVQWWARIVEQNETIHKDEQAESYCEQATDWALWFAHGKPHYRQLLPEEVIVLQALQQGASFGEVCESLLQVMDEQTIPTWIGDYLQRLIRDGWLQDLTDSKK